MNENEQNGYMAQAFWTRVRTCINKQGYTSIYAWCHDNNVAYSSYKNYESQDKLPGLINIRKYSELLHKSIDYLVFGVEGTTTISVKAEQVALRYDAATPMERELVDRILKVTD